MISTSNVPISGVAAVDNLLRAATNLSISDHSSCPQKSTVKQPHAPSQGCAIPVKRSSMKSRSNPQRRRRNVQFPQRQSRLALVEDRESLLKSLDGDSETTATTSLSSSSRTEQQPPQEEASYLEIHHPGPDIDLLIANRKDLWYQQEELKHMKRKALVVSKEAQRYGLGSILTNTYGNHNHHPHNQQTASGGGTSSSPSSASCSNSDDPAAGSLNSDTQQALNTWSRNGNSRRGLERWINDEYAAKRSDIRKRTIQSVLRAQAKMRESALAPGVQQNCDLKN